MWFLNKVYSITTVEIIHGLGECPFRTLKIPLAKEKIP